MKFTAWVMGIVGSLVVGGIGALLTVTMTDAKADGANEERSAHVAKRIDEHDAKLEEIGKSLGVLERIDERLGSMERRMERLENKQDEALRRGRGR